jgi:hypothetical protein
VSSVKYELGFYIPEDHILHNHRRENLKPYTPLSMIEMVRMWRKQTRAFWRA